MMFELPAIRRSSSKARQVLIYGAVRDSLTPALPPRGAFSVRLIDRDALADYPLAGKVLPDGSYAFYALPDTAFPELSSVTYRLQVEASAPGYIARRVDFEIGPIANQPQATTRAVAQAGVTPMSVVLFTADLPRRVDLNLDREAVRLAGRVVNAANPQLGVPGATLALNPPAIAAAVTDAGGNFRFADLLPVALALEIDVTAAGFDNESVTFEPDHTRPVNSLVVSLSEEE